MQVFPMLATADAIQGHTGYLSPDEQKKVFFALKKAIEWHDGQTRSSGEPYVTHPIAVATYLAGLEACSETLCAALLHDVVEDERATLDEVEKLFDSKVALLVDGVTKLSKIAYEGRRTERQVASLRKMLLTANEDLRVIFIKLADRWHNVQTLDALRPEKQQRIAHETLDIYVPFARLVGLWDLKSELENICFPLAYPQESKEWQAAIMNVREEVNAERQEFVKHVNAETTDEVQAVIDTMTDFEIYQRLQGNLRRLSDTYNVDSVLILLTGDTVLPTDCYRVLGDIHGKHPVSIASFRDYISAPQSNGYRGLHTTIFLSKDHRVRLRIRTHDMQDYTSKRKLSAWASDRHNDIYKALSSLHTSPSFDQDGYIDDLQSTVLKERINVFTPSGEIITLPESATGVDFAFAINPDHIAYLSGIRINGGPKEATHVLHDGDTVELVLRENGKEGVPTMWVDKVKSVEAREGLKESLRSTPEDTQTEEGKHLLAQELEKHHLPSWSLFKLSSVQSRLTSELRSASYKKLLQDVGSGVLPVGLVVDTYRKILTSHKTWLVSLLKFLHLLPRSRVLNEQSTVIKTEIYAEDRKGLIHDITQCFADRDINIAKFGVFAVPPKDALYKIDVEVQNFDQFSDLYDALLQVPNVKQILRKS